MRFKHKEEKLAGLILSGPVFSCEPKPQAKGETWKLLWLNLAQSVLLSWLKAPS